MNNHFSTNKRNYTLESGVLETAMVDHYIVYAIRKVNSWRLNSKRGNKIAESRKMKNYDNTAFQQELNASDWESLLEPFSQDPCKIASI